MRKEFIITAALLLALFALPSLADSMVARAPNGDIMRLTTNACVNDKVLAHVPPQYRSQMQAGSAVISGKPHSMCWLLRLDGAVVAVYEDGEGAVVPVGVFELERGL